MPKLYYEKDRAALDYIGRSRSEPVYEHEQRRRPKDGPIEHRAEIYDFGDNAQFDPLVRNPRKDWPLPSIQRRFRLIEIKEPPKPYTNPAIERRRKQQLRDFEGHKPLHPRFRLLCFD